MKKILKQSLVFTAILSSTLLLTGIVNKTPAYAADEHKAGDCVYFLGLTSWDCDVTQITNENELSANIWMIAANILTDIGIVAAYLIIGYVIYGGYLYMFSSGDAGKVAAGKKTLTHAFIGLAIVTLANVILGSVRIALIGNGNSLSNCASSDTACINGTPEALVTNLISWVIGVAGVVSVVFIIIGGVGYLTSSGDAGKLQKAKNTITYALIGLAIVALSGAIVAFVSGIIRNSAP